MAKRETTKYSVSFVIRRMQINATITYHYIPTRMIYIKKKKSQHNCWKHMELLELSFIADGSINFYNHFGELFAVSYKVKCMPTFWPFLSIYPKYISIKIDIQQYS